MYPSISKIASFQGIIHIKVMEIFYIAFIIVSLWNCMHSAFPSYLSLDQPRTTRCSVATRGFLLLYQTAQLCRRLCAHFPSLWAHEDYFCALSGVLHWQVCMCICVAAWCWAVSRKPGPSAEWNPYGWLHGAQGPLFVLSETCSEASSFPPAPPQSRYSFRQYPQLLCCGPYHSCDYMLPCGIVYVWIYVILVHCCIPGT